MSDISARSMSAERRVAADFRRLLHCPRCDSSDLSWTQSEVACVTCAARWPLLDGEIPDFVSETLGADAALREEVACQDRAAPIYDDPRTLAYHADRVALRRLTDLFAIRSGLVLDLGCGVGHVMEWRRDFDVVGVDVAPALLRRARARSEFVVRADARALPFAAGTFDAVLARGILHHTADPAAVLARAHRVLKPGGEIVLHDPRAFAFLETVKRAIRRGSDHFSRLHTAFDRQDYRTLLEGAGFRIERFEDWDPVGILGITAADLLHLGRVANARALTSAFLSLDALFDRSLRHLSPWQEWGFILAVHARKASV